MGYMKWKNLEYGYIKVAENENLQLLYGVPFCQPKSDNVIQYEKNISMNV